MNVKEGQLFVCIRVASWLRTDLRPRGDNFEPRIDANERERGSVIRVYSRPFAVKNRSQSPRRQFWTANRR